MKLSQTYLVKYRKKELLWGIRVAHADFVWSDPDEWTVFFMQLSDPMALFALEDMVNMVKPGDGGEERARDVFDR